MSLLSLLKQYISLKIDQLEGDNHRDIKLTNLIEAMSDFISSDKLEKLINVSNAAEAKGYLDKSRDFKPTNDEIEQVGKEVVYNMEHRSIPYLIEMLNLDICYTLREKYGNNDTVYTFDINHHTIFIVPENELDLTLKRILIKLLTSTEKDEIILLVDKIAADDKINTKLINFYHTIETKASNKIVATLINLISDEKLSNR